MTLDEAKTLLRRWLRKRTDEQTEKLVVDTRAALTRGRGAPVKYDSDEERDEARRKQFRESKRRARS